MRQINFSSEQLALLNKLHHYEPYLTTTVEFPENYLKIKSKLQTKESGKVDFPRSLLVFPPISFEYDGTNETPLKDLDFTSYSKAEHEKDENGLEDKYAEVELLSFLESDFKLRNINPLLLDFLVATFNQSNIGFVGIPQFLLKNFFKYMGNLDMGQSATSHTGFHILPTKTPDVIFIRDFYILENLFFAEYDMKFFQREDHTSLQVSFVLEYKITVCQNTKKVSTAINKARLEIENENEDKNKDDFNKINNVISIWKYFLSLQKEPNQSFDEKKLRLNKDIFDFMNEPAISDGLLELLLNKTDIRCYHPEKMLALLKNSKDIVTLNLNHLPKTVEEHLPNIILNNNNLQIIDVSSTNFNLALENVGKKRFLQNLNIFACDRISPLTLNINHEFLLIDLIDFTNSPQPNISTNGLIYFEIPITLEIFFGLAEKIENNIFFFDPNVSENLTVYENVEIIASLKTLILPLLKRHTNTIVNKLKNIYEPFGEKIEHRNKIANQMSNKKIESKYEYVERSFLLCGLYKEQDKIEKCLTLTLQLFLTEKAIKKTSKETVKEIIKELLFYEIQYQHQKIIGSAFVDFQKNILSIADSIKKSLKLFSNENGSELFTNPLFSAKNVNEENCSKKVVIKPSHPGRIVYQGTVDQDFAIPDNSFFSKTYKYPFHYDSKNQEIFLYNPGTADSQVQLWYALMLAYSIGWFDIDIKTVEKRDQEIVEIKNSESLDTLHKHCSSIFDTTLSWKINNKVTQFDFYKKNNDFFPNRKKDAARKLLFQAEILQPEEQPEKEKSLCSIQ